MSASTVLRPVGPRPERVYWVRRAVVLLVLVALLAGGWWLLSRAGGDDAGAAQTDGEAGAVPEDAEGAADPGGPAACTGGDVALTLSTDTRVWPAGESPALSLAVTNAGAQSCTIDVGPASREILVTSGTDRIWSSLDCPAEDAEPRMLLLEPGARETTTLTWDRVRSAEGCPDGLPEPRPGTYTAVAAMLDVQSAPAVFELR